MALFGGAGPGIPPEKLGVIFNPFVQGDIPFHHKLGSTGLGLSLVKAVIESHGGTVGAQSELGVKTTIKITLPLHNGGQSDRSGISRRPSSCQIFSAAESDSNTHNDNLEVASDSAPEAFSGKHPFKTEILSVDDDPMNHMVLGNMLTPQNYSVLQAVSGEQALAILKDRYAKGGNDWLPPIILMDAMMPGMDGFQTVTAIRSLFPTADMAIMMVSAKATEDAISRGFQAGCNDYITKPVKV